MAIPVPTFRVLMGAEYGALPTIETDISDYVQSYSFRRGRDNVLSSFQAGTATLVVRNADGRFSPAYTGGAYYGVLDVMIRVRIEVILNGITYPRFWGYIQSIRPNPEDCWNFTNIELSDIFAWLSIRNALVSYGPGDTNAGTAIGTLLNIISWPAGLRELDAGYHTWPSAPSLGTTTALSQANTLAANDLGRFYGGQEGDAVFEQDGQGHGGKDFQGWIKSAKCRAACPATRDASCAGRSRSFM